MNTFCSVQSKEHRPGHPVPRSHVLVRLPVDGVPTGGSQGSLLVEFRLQLTAGRAQLGRPSAEHRRAIVLCRALKSSRWRRATDISLRPDLLADAYRSQPGQFPAHDSNHFHSSLVCLGQLDRRCQDAAPYSSGNCPRRPWTTGMTPCRWCLQFVVHSSQASSQAIVLQREHGFERAYLSLDIEYDLSSLFSWNTKQV